MVSFQRMKDEIDGWGNTITSRVPVISKSGCLLIVAISVFLLVILGFAIGYGSRPSQPASASALIQKPNYVFVSNTSGSCPPLAGQRLLTTMNQGDSFEGMYFNLYTGLIKDQML